MKKIMFFAAVAFMATSCIDSNDYPTSPQTNDVIDISAVIANVTSTRTSIDDTAKATWIEDDAIGLFSPQSNPVGANVKFTVTGIASTPVWAPETSLYWVDSKTEHTFTAYAPYAGDNSSAESVKIPAINSQTGVVVPAQDFLISNKLASEGVVRGSDVALEFTHAFSLIEFDMTIDAGMKDGTTLTSFTVAGGVNDKLFTSDANSTIALADGTITAGNATNTITVTPATAPELSSDKASSQYLLLLPGTYTAPTLAISLKDGGTTDYSIAALPIETPKFEAGKRYKYAVTISRKATTISNPTITDWTTVPGSPISPIL